MLKEVKTSVTRLIALYEMEKERADALSLKLSESEEQNRQYKEQITELNLKIDNLALSNAFTACGDNVQAKERVEKLIKEIDKCIKFLQN